MVKNNHFDSRLFDNLRPIMATGLPVINLPVMEPMSLEEIKFHLQDGLIDVTVTFSNLTIVGLSTFETTLAKKVGRYMTTSSRAVLENSVNSCPEMSSNLVSTYLRWKPLVTMSWRETLLLSI